MIQGNNMLAKKDKIISNKNLEQNKTNLRAVDNCTCDINKI